jgi:hypothetical protein
VIAIGVDPYSAGELATRTGGAFAYAEHPDQLPVVFSALNSIISHELAYNRVRIRLDSEPGSFVPGRTVMGYLQIRIGTNARAFRCLRIPI